MTGPELIRAARDIAAVLEDAGPDEVAEYVAKWANAAESKAEAYVAVARRLDDEAAIAKADEADAKARRVRAEASRDRVLDLLRALVESAEALGESVPGVRLQRTAPRVEAPESIEAWPEAWRRVRVEPDRAAAREALLAGEAVPGFALIESRALYGWRRKGGA